jgi:hypothetical protein
MDSNITKYRTMQGPINLSRGIIRCIGREIKNFLRLVVVLHHILVDVDSQDIGH